MSKKTSKVRLQKEMRAFVQDPPPFIPRVHVNERNMLEWHLLMEGPHGTPFEDGWYVAKLKFPGEYPFKPPSIFMCTPNGRFATGTRLCLSMSDFHPESWNPGWSVATVAKGLLSFLLEDAVTTGAVVTTEEEKRRLARESAAWNMTHGTFKAMFPELEDEASLDAIREKKTKSAGDGAEGAAAAAAAGTGTGMGTGTGTGTVPDGGDAAAAAAEDAADGMKKLELE